MFTDAEKVDVRRQCGYPAAGSTGPNANTGYRFFQSYGLLEYRMENMAASEEAVVRTYLTDLAQLERDIVGVRENLDTDKAAVWTHNKNEQSDREALYDEWRRRLVAFIGVPPGPNLPARGARMVV